MKEIFRGRYFRLAMIFVVLPLLLFFLLRGIFLDYTLKQIQDRIKTKYGATFVYSKAEFKGISGISIENTGLLTPAGDTLFFIREISAGVRLLPLIGGKIRLASIEGSNGQVQLISTKNKNTFSWLIPHEKDREQSTENNNIIPDYPALISKIRTSLFESVPDFVRLTHLSAILQKDTSETRLGVPVALLEDGHFSARIKGEDNLGIFEWTTAGDIDAGSGSARIVLYPVSSKKNRIPFTGSWIKLKAGMDTLKIDLHESGMRENTFKMEGDIQVNGMWINHWRLAPSEIQIGSASLQYMASLSESNVTLEAGSKAILNQLNIELAAEYRYQAEKKYRLEARIPQIESQAFFQSLPAGLFTNLEGIKTKGFLSYSLDFELESERPDAVIFRSDLQERNFRISDMGKENPAKLNQEFIHNVYEKGQLVKQFPVGPSNPDFVPLTEISPTLISSVLTSEDGNFFSHHGFNGDAFRKSIAENYRKGKFARGGSTISMQLVKNVFLTRNKTIARKIEEALLVWLIEEHRLVSKERMLEVYLNIIEWGPGIYGIGQASKFYFNKKPSLLSLEECIFLAMIIPRPKGFAYHFDPEGALKEYTSGYFNLLGGLLIRKGVIDSTQKNPETSKIIINGPAKNYLFKNDSITPVDSSFIENTSFTEEIP